MDYGKIYPEEEHLRQTLSSTVGLCSKYSVNKLKNIS